MAEPRIKLYSDDYWISPYVFSVFVALEEKQVEFEVVPVSLNEKEQTKAAYVERTITARVPALDDGGFVLAESSAIIEYLEDAYAPPGYPRLLPAITKDRARARQIMAWIRSDLMALREERPTTTMFYERATTPLTEQGRAAAAKLLSVADRLIPVGGTPLFGRWSIADSDLAFMLHRLLLSGHDVPARIRAYAEAEWARPSVRKYVDHPRKPYVPYG